MNGPVKRQYDSSRRREQALENRRRILSAAHALFITRGYGRTTIADVAAEAGVAPETVYAAFKNKPALLHRAWDVAVGGDEQEVPLLERPELRAVFAEPELPARFAALAVVNTAVMRRTARLHLAVRGAAASEPAAAALLEEIDRERLAAMAEHARAAAVTGQLGVSEDECRDVLWSTTDGTLWHRLVEQRGWSDERYAAWLGGLWVAALVG
ncbi:MULTISPECIES: helix-turn-helix domain-containing protein [unclassified Amycolatopsis]|uniref:TetR/AcrR family transcriptional regulator n=1 Tax=unclassified Amycolatopsis TaxID=2618356 RepID=UPI0028764ABA|nr:MULTISPECIES: helix-turn-helix domain-containing protein [unclassified Amycolatopsis]MDS0137170.1 TetR/AcrR family transcriptional regulator [Amycolatopsis sp. 505]MDS0143835.1 TetR/AcrR family transcriptional regulator [Amycolatopsis sp. CM201R]